LLSRTPVVVGEFVYIGKETDRRWEKGEEISILNSKITIYQLNETRRLGTDVLLQQRIRQVSIRKLAREARVSVNTVKAARRGNRLQKTTITRLLHVLNSITSPK
jgi:hypothetical protein